MAVSATVTDPPESKDAKARGSRLAAKWLLVGAVALVVLAIAAYFALPKLLPAGGDSSADPVTETADPPQQDSLIKRETALARREKELQAREAALQEKEAEVDRQLRELPTQQAQADSVRSSAAIYGAMPPDKAASLMELLDVETAVKIIRYLDEDQAAAILACMPRTQGTIIMESLLEQPVPETPSESSETPETAES